MRCLSCNYELANLTEHRCPECGRGFDPKNPRTFLAGTRRKLKHRDHVLRALIYGPLFTWFVWFCWVVVQPDPGSSLFENISGSVSIAVILTIWMWPWLLASIPGMYVLLLGISIARRKSHSPG